MAFFELNFRRAVRFLLAIYRPLSLLTVSLWRPLARRALRTPRPPWVFIRARKPWARLRRRRWGWNVYFTQNLLSGGS